MDRRTRTHLTQCHGDFINLCIEKPNQTVNYLTAMSLAAVRPATNRTNTNVLGTLLDLLEVSLGPLRVLLPCVNLLCCTMNDDLTISLLFGFLSNKRYASFQDREPGVDCVSKLNVMGLVGLQQILDVGYFAAYVQVSKVAAIVIDLTGIDDEGEVPWPSD